MLMSRDTEKYKGFRDARVYRHHLWAAGCWGAELGDVGHKTHDVSSKKLGFSPESNGSFWRI